MSDGGYTEIDLDAVEKKAGELPDIEIVEEEEAPVPKQEAQPELEEQDEEEGDGEGRKRLTRSQRLKAARDKALAELERERSEKATLAARVAALEKQQGEAADAGYDFVVQSLDQQIKAMKAAFDKAYADGNQEQLFELQTQLADLVAEKKMVERTRKSVPPKSGGEPQPPTQPTTDSAPKAEPRPKQLAAHQAEWLEANKGWFRKDVQLTLAAEIIAANLGQEGYSADDEDFFEELDKRLRKELPQKFAAPKPKQSPTVQARQSVVPQAGKVKVRITAEDREMARQLNIDVTEYARHKARREMAESSASGYTEIV